MDAHERKRPLPLEKGCTRSREPTLAPSSHLCSQSRSQRPGRKARFGGRRWSQETVVVTGLPSHCREQQPPPHRALSEALAGPAAQ